MVKAVPGNELLALWIVSLLLSLLMASGLVFWIIPRPVWSAAAFGWLAAGVNALVARAIHARATVGGRGGFVRWGLVGNGIRMLTLVMIFAYMTVHFESERRSFLVAGFSGFFMLLPVGIAQLFRFQNKSGVEVEFRRDAN